MDEIVNNWIKNNPTLDKEKIKKLTESVSKFIEINYSIDAFYYHFDDICLYTEDESGSGGFWDASNYLVQEKYDIAFTNDDDEAFDEQTNLYDVLTCMRGYYFSEDELIVEDELTSDEDED